MTEEKTTPSPASRPALKPAAVRAQPASAAPPASNALTIRDLSVFFGEVQVLKKVSLEIQARAVTAIIGPSGCGKSTFLRALNRMHELVPTARMEGDIRLFDQDIYIKDV